MSIDDGVLDSNRLYKETLPEYLHTLSVKPFEKYFDFFLHFMVY